MPRNLLVVDDSPTIGEAVRCALTGEEWAVTAVTTQAQALEAIRRNLPDLVLCDVALGDEDGYQVCRALQAAAGASLPVILMGGTVSEHLASGAGAVAVFAKPFHSDELLEVLQTALEQAPLSAGEEEFLSLEPVASAGLGAEASPAGVAGVDEVEIIDLSDGEDLPDVEFLDDLEPLPAPLRDTGIGQGEPLPLSAGELDFGTLGEEEKPEAFAARALDRDESGGAGPVEFDLSDFETEPEPVRDLGAPRPAEAAPLLPDLDLSPLGGPGAPSAPSLEVQPEDLLEDIDLEGWAEEDLPAGQEGAASLQGSALEPADRLVGAPTQAGSFDFGLEDLEPLAPEGGEARGEALAPASGTFELREETEESWDEEPDAGLAGEVEQPRPAFALELERPAATDVFAAEPAGAEPSGEGAPAPLWPEEPEDVWEASEPLALAEASGVAEAGAFGETVPGLELEGLSLEEPSAPGEPLELLGETLPRKDEREAWGAEPSGPSAIPWSEEPFPAPAEERAEGEAWAEAPPTFMPASEVPWDRSALEPETLATQVAADAGEAVRRALLESLSPDKLTPLVAATVERVVWEVVPQLAERLIREAIEKLQSEPPDDD